MSEGAKLRVILDPNLCVGHGRCYELAVEVFEEDERGHCVIRRALVPAEFEADARRAVVNCPEGALELEEADDT